MEKEFNNAFLQDSDSVRSSPSSTPPDPSPELHTPPMSPTEMVSFLQPAIPRIEPIIVGSPAAEHYTQDYLAKALTTEAPPIVPEQSPINCSKPEEAEEVSPESESPISLTDEGNYGYYGNTLFLISGYYTII